MSHGPSRIPSKGACIYCGTTTAVLTDEHILPLFIGGQHIIEKASCHKCATLTSKFELDVARKLWGDARNSFNAPSRRKKNRKTHILLEDPDHIGAPLKIPYYEYPAPMIFYQMGTAGMLAGFSKDIDRSALWTMSALVDEKKKNVFLEKYPGRLTAKFIHVPHSFARMLAKIGYCQILWHLNPEDFDCLCLPYILGREKNLSHIVGAASTVPPPWSSTGYSMRTLVFGDAYSVLLVAEIRLVADHHTPLYHVVVGKVEGPERVSFVQAKLDHREGCSSMSVADARESQGDIYKWLPSKWPLT